MRQRHIFHKRKSEKVSIREYQKFHSWAPEMDYAFIWFYALPTEGRPEAGDSAENRNPMVLQRVAMLLVRRPTTTTGKGKRQVVRPDGN